ncbi:LOW QUALITY PROTEIN: lymphoid-restricted membrane protein, partial [Plakobranchus ocellatus]
AVVVPSSPPRDHKTLTVTHQVQPLKPSRLAQIRQNNLAIKKQMKTKSMKLPELSETSEADTPSPVTEVIATTNSSPSPLQPLPPHGSPYQQRRSSSPALNSDRPPPTAKVMPQISITDEDGLDIVPACPPGSDPSTPLTLPQAFLRKLGLAVEDDDKDTRKIPGEQLWIVITKVITNPYSVDQLSEKEIESKFVTLSLAFKTDKLTLDQRVIVQERARDLAEQNVDAELQGIRDAIETLGDLAFDPQVRDVVEKIRLHIDVLEISAAKVSSRAEVFGAVQQERRLCKAMEVMVQYTENLRRIRAKEESEVQEARKVLSERSGVGYTLDVDSAGPARRSMSVCGFSPGIRTMRRRSEVALPRILGGTGSPSPAQEGDIFHPERLPASHSFSNIHQAPEEEEGPKARFQSAVASTSMQHAVTATMRRTSTDRERRVSLAAPVSPLVTNGAGSGNSVGVDGSNGKLKKMSPQPSLSVTVEDEGDSCEASETSTSETTPARKVSQDEQAYRKGFEQGLKAKLNEQLTQLRDQQNNISQSLEAVMDRVDQGESEEAEFLASPTRLETLLTVTAKVREYVLAYDWRSNKTAIRNLAGVAFLLLAMLMMFISPPLPAHTRASSIDSPPNHPSLPRH